MQHVTFEQTTIVVNKKQSFGEEISTKNKS